MHCLVDMIAQKQATGYYGVTSVQAKDPGVSELKRGRQYDRTYDS